MKKLNLLLGLLIAGLLPVFANAACDQSFTDTLRLGGEYDFGDDYNANSSDKWVWNFWYSYEERGGDFNKSTYFPEFQWTQAIRNADWKIAKNTTMSVIETDSTKPGYKVLAVPEKRAYDNLVLTYTIESSTNKAGNNKYNHTECVYYAITRCGDGVIDTDEGEVCDPGDSTKKNRGNGGCDNVACTPITVASAACNSEYNGQRVTNLTESSKLCSEGTASDFNYDSTNHKWTWKCGNVAGTKECYATKPYCGDGIKDEGEICDPKDSNKTGWGNGGCDNSCQPITIGAPACNSEYNGQRVTNLTESSKLCSEGTASDFNYDSTNHKWTWKCSNVAGTKECYATKPYCGDGIKDNSEVCDPEDPNKEGWGNGGCSTACAPITVASAACNSEYNGQRVANLTESSKLCSEGTASDFNYDSTNHKWTWKCKNSLGSGVDCSAIKPYCGDGIRDEGEACDPKDPSQTGWGNGGCDNSCEPINETEGCDYDFYGTLRYLSKYTFYDEFSANSSDKWLKNWAMEYQEEYDYNKSPSFPIFGWTTELINNNYRVPAGTTMTVLKADSEYPILAVPASRSYDNLFIKYTLTYSTDAAGTKKYKHAECGHYEVSWCGDGVLDIAQPGDKWESETCDPKDSSHTGWGNGGCDEECKPITITTGKLKIEKTLIGSKEIKNTGDNIVWKITVTAEGGDVTDFVVVDKMPSILGYKDYLITHNEGLTIGSPVLSGNEVSWDVKGTLEKGKYIEIQLITYAKEMPDRDYDNVACVKYDGKEDCDDESIPSPKLRIKKTFIDGSKTKTVNIGDLIGYKITFGNSGNASATITSLKDFLPKNVEYVSSEIFVNGQSVHSNGTESGVYMDIYGGLTLEPKAEGYIILTGKVLADNQDSRTNFACIYLNDNKIDCDDVIHNFDDGLSCTTPDIATTSFEKEGGSTSVVCKTSGKDADLIELDCGNGTTFTGSNVSSLSGTCTYPANGSTSTNSYTVVCKVNNTTKDICKGTISVKGKSNPPGPNDPYCTKPDVSGSDRVKTVVCKTDNGKTADIKIDCGYGNQVYTSTGKALSLTGTCDYTNAGYGTYKILCYANDKNLSHCNDSVEYKSSSGCFPAGTKVIMADGTSKNIEEVQEGEVILSYNTETNVNEGNVVKKKLVHEDNVHEMYELTINGKVLKVTDVHRFYVRKSVDSKNYDWIEARNLKVGDILLMGNGNLVKIENISHYSNKQTVYNFEIENNHNYFVGEGYLVHNSKTGNPPSNPPSNPVYDKAACFNVNANNVSIEQGEYLPFFWNIKNIKNIEDWATELTGGYQKTVSSIRTEIIKNNEGNKCSDNNLIALNSMICHFEIKNNTKTVYEGSFPCLRDTDNRGTNWTSDVKLLDAWMKYGKNKYSGDGTYKFFRSFTNKDGPVTLRSNLNAISTKDWKVDTFGEYKLSLTNIEYLQCQKNKWTLVSPKIADCESNFMLTNPYTVQKTPSGNLKASTEVLGKYFVNMNGKSAFNYASEYLQAIASTELDYKPNTQIETAMTNFINKYKKLAVSVKGGLMKVPGKSIYFVDKDISLGCKDSQISLKTPTTVVQTNGNTKICGSVENLNIMILTKGSITFEDTNPCNPEVVNQPRQVVKGIFYAENGLYRLGVKKNDDLYEHKRCTQGGLTIKGVLIGGGLQKMMEKSRSNLNDWFENDNKKGVVMNGASVLIEYSPSVFTKSTMSPGAEDFTTALSIYKN